MQFVLQDSRQRVAATIRNKDLCRILMGGFGCYALQS
jgi:hypothetical protein